MYRFSVCPGPVMRYGVSDPYPKPRGPPRGTLGAFDPSPGIVKAPGLDENARREPGARPERRRRVRFTLLSRVL